MLEIYIKLDLRFEQDDKNRKDSTCLNLLLLTLPNVRLTDKAK